MSKQKIYAVATGRRPGIYAEWFGENGAGAQVKSFAGARYKGFTSRAEAEASLASCYAGFALDCRIEST